MLFVRSMRQLLVIVSAASLVACGGVGTGNKLNFIRIVTGDTNAPIQNDVIAYQCLRQNVHLLGTFTDGTVGDYSTRALWTSTDDSIVHVSNAILPADAVPSTLAPNGQPESNTLVYAKGTLVPGANAGTAVITATYLGMSSSVTVQVKTPAAIFISKDTPSYINGKPLTAPGATPSLTPKPAMTIAPLSLQPLHVLADLDGNGVPSDVSSFALWSIPADPSGAIATVSSNGIVGGVAINPAAPVNVHVNFDSCPSIPPGVVTTIDTALTVANIDHLEMRSEQQNNALYTNLPGKLIALTSEAMQVLAHFDATNVDNDPVSHPTQDLSTQSHFYADYNQDCPNLNQAPANPPVPNPNPVTELAFSPIPALANIAVAGAQASINPFVKLSASFVVNKPVGGLAQSICAANDVQRAVVLGTLNAVAIRADQKNLTIQPRGSQ
ncbi:MAG: hypothetical protein ACRETE_02120, partial [Stenotrophobium sp.]